MISYSVLWIVVSADLLASVHVADLAFPFFGLFFHVLFILNFEQSLL